MCLTQSYGLPYHSHRVLKIYKVVMSAHKNDPLFLPENSEIAVTERGFELINEGDIVVRSRLAVGSLRSLHGDIHLIPPAGERQVISYVEAPNGTVKLVGDEFDIAEIRAREIVCDSRTFSSRVIKSEGLLQILRGRLNCNVISAKSIHFDGTEFNAQHVSAQEEIRFSCDSITSQTVSGNHISLQTRGRARVGKIIAHGEIRIDSHTVDIDYLSTNSLQITSRTHGVVVCLDGPAPTEPNSIVGMLSPATLVEKIPALTGLIKEIQSVDRTAEQVLPVVSEAQEMAFKRRDESVIDTISTSIPEEIRPKEPPTESPSEPETPAVASELEVSPQNLLELPPLPDVEPNVLPVTSDGVIDLGLSTPGVKIPDDLKGKI